MSSHGRRTIAIVGNGPVEEGSAAAIEACDRVIRFNKPAHTPEQAGTKTDILFFMNSGKGAQALLSDPDFLRLPAVAACSRVILPYHPSIIARYHPKPNPLSRLKGRRADWTEKAVEVFGGAGKEVTVLPPEFYAECCDELRIGADERQRNFPSTGFVAIMYAMKEFPQTGWAIDLFGFGWQGWKRHDWEAERTWVRAKVSSSRPRRIRP